MIRYGGYLKTGIQAKSADAAARTWVASSAGSSAPGPTDNLSLVTAKRLAGSSNLYSRSTGRPSAGCCRPTACSRSASRARRERAGRSRTRRPRSPPRQGHNRRGRLRRLPPGRVRPGTRDIASRCSPCGARARTPPVQRRRRRRLGRQTDGEQSGLRDGQVARSAPTAPSSRGRSRRADVVPGHRGREDRQAPLPPEPGRQHRRQPDWLAPGTRCRTTT